MINDNSLGPAGSTQRPAILLAVRILARRATISAGISVGGSVLKPGWLLSLRVHRGEVTLEVDSTKVQSAMVVCDRRCMAME